MTLHTDRPVALLPIEFWEACKRLRRLWMNRDDR